MKKIDICPICEEGNLNHIVEQDTAEYKGKQGTVALHFSECDACGSEQANAVDVRNNKRAMQAFKKTVDGLLTGADIKEIRGHYSLTQSQAATIFGGGPVAFSKYEADDVMQSEPMDNLLRLCRKNSSALIWLAKKAGENDVAVRLAKLTLMKFESVKRKSRLTSIVSQGSFISDESSSTANSNVHIFSDYPKVAV